VQVALGPRGHRLSRDGSGRVSGLDAFDSAGKVTRLPACTGIVLSCGGFAWNRAMTRDNLGSDIAALSPPGGPPATAYGWLRTSGLPCGT
jgi:hypothetical protein